MADGYFYNQGSDFLTRRYKIQFSRVKTQRAIIEIKDGTTTVAQYEYDALGRRIKKVATTTTLYYHNTNWQVLLEASPSGATVGKFLQARELAEVRFVLFSESDLVEYQKAKDEIDI